MTYSSVFIQSAFLLKSWLNHSNLTRKSLGEGILLFISQEILCKEIVILTLANNIEETFAKKIRKLKKISFSYVYRVRVTTWWFFRSISFQHQNLWCLLLIGDFNCENMECTIPDFLNQCHAANRERMLNMYR